MRGNLRLGMAIERTPPRLRLRRELLRWRDLIAGLYIERDSEPAGHSAAFRALLLFTPRAAQQIPFVSL
jgi:hypothetical protein